MSPLALALWTTLAAADGGTAVSPATLVRPVLIEGDHLQIFDKRHLMIWRGHVRAQRDDVNIACDQMTAYYTGNQDNVTRTLCEGHVVVVEGDRWGKGDHADFNNVTGVLVVTGSPEAHQGKSTIKGSKVTFYIGTDQLDVDQANAVIEEGKQKPVLPKVHRRPAGEKAP